MCRPSRLKAATLARRSGMLDDAAMRSSAASACLLFLAALIVQPARAADDFFDNDVETPSPITDRFSLRASFFDAKVETDLRVDGASIPLSGTVLSGAHDLGFRPSESDGMAELMFRLRDRNRITAGFLELDQSGTTTVTRPIVFGGQVYNPGDRLSTSLQWRVMNLTWTYALIQNDRFELAAGVGGKRHRYTEQGPRLHLRGGESRQPHLAHAGRAFAVDMQPGDAVATA